MRGDWILSNGIKSKFGELTHMVHNEQPDLIVVVESKLAAPQFTVEISVIAAL